MHFKFPRIYMFITIAYFIVKFVLQKFQLIIGNHLQQQLNILKSNFCSLVKIEFSI